ncbi:MAG: EI24 domain-containing protein [Epsilonproteobacteria bacterium]|nr:EI24 domain-containing protein [Campylobacterota bacterium]
MKATLESIIFGFREILTWHIMRYALISGLIVIAIWMGLGAFVWDGLVSVSESIIGILPLNMMISDGATMLSMFIWLMAVFLTFALVYVFLGNFLLNKIEKERYLSISLILIVISAIFWMAIWMLNQDLIHDKIAGFLKTLPYTTVQHSLAYLLAGYIIYNAIIISMLFIVNLFNKPLLSHISQKYYNEDVQQHNKMKSFGYTIKDTLVFMVVSLLAFPLLFIPFVNFLVQIGLWMWLTKDTIEYNTASLVFKDIDKELLKKNRAEVWFISFVTVFFNLIPIFNIFAPFFGEIAMFHYWKKIEKEV